MASHDGTELENVTVEKSKDISAIKQEPVKRKENKDKEITKEDERKDRIEDKDNNKDRGRSKERKKK